MSVRAKFFVGKLDNPEGATAAFVGLSAVCRGVENSLWSQATPAGSITMNVKNDPAFEQFEMGAEYEVTFRKVNKPAPGDGHSIIEAVTMHGAIVCEVCGAQLGYAAQAIEKQSYLAQYSTEEIKAEARQRHEETFGKSEKADG